jgi:hypothetical protein
MALRWLVSASERLVIVQTHGRVKISDLEEVLLNVRAKAAMSYHKILDARLGHTTLTAVELAIYQQMIDDCALHFQLGPCAIVADETAMTLHNPLITLLLSNSRRASGLFMNLQDAREWLRTQPLPLNYQR